MKVDIVVPTLGERPEFLQQTLNSIQVQSVPHEVIVVTSGSGAEHLADQCRGLKVVVQTGRGIANAIEEGWAAPAQPGEFVCWLGDDDLLSRDSFSLAVAALLAEPRAGMVYGRCVYLDASGRPRAEIRPGRIATALFRLGRNLIAQPGCLYRREAVRRVGGLDQSYALAFDVALHVSLATKTGARYVPHLLGAARAHPGSLTTAQRERSQAEALQAMRPVMPAWLSAQQLQRLGNAIADVHSKISVVHRPAVDGALW